jgi:hypothetical protein
MKKAIHTYGIWLGSLACLTWLLPTQAMAAEVGQRTPAGAAAIPMIRDIALGKNGSLSGQLLDAQGHGRANEMVVIHRQGAEPRQVQTDSQGRFAVSGLSGGTYQICVGDCGGYCDSYCRE